jgi:hypothetical protein
MAQQKSDPAVACQTLLSQDWDEVVRALAEELGELAENHPAEAETARRLAFSLLELVGLAGIVSVDFVADMVGRADKLLRAERVRPGFCVPKLYDDSEDDEITKPEGVIQRRPRSGTRRIDPRAEPIRLRLRAS